MAEDPYGPEGQWRWDGHQWNPVPTRSLDLVRTLVRRITT